MVHAVDAASAPSLSTLLEQLNRLEQTAHNSSNSVDPTRINTFVHELTSHIPPTTPSPSFLAELFADDVGYDILHCLLPLVSADSLQSAAGGGSEVREVAGAVLTCCVLYGSPREVFLPLLSHLSAHITPLAQQQEEKQQQLVDEHKQRTSTVVQPSIPYVSFLLPYFVCLLQREKHAGRSASMFKSLSALLAAFFAAIPSEAALTAVLSPLRPVLQVDCEAHTALLLSLLALFLPPHYPQLASHPSPAFSLLLSSLPNTATSATFHLAALTAYLHRRQLLTQQLSAMRQQSWELTEDEESMTRAQHESWHAAATADDEADDDEEDEADEAERQRRGELRHTKAQLAALPPYPPAGVVCLVLMNLSSQDRREVEQLVTGQEGGVAGLRLYVDAMLGTEMAAGYRQLMIDFLHRWLSLLSPQSVDYTPIPLSAAAFEEQAKDDCWMLAECITTLMMQPPPVTTASSVQSAPAFAAPSTASSVLPLYLSRFTPASRLTLTASLIAACPFPPIQAILVSTLKDVLLTDGSEQQVTVVIDLLVSLVAQWSDVSAVLERVDGLMAALNVLRYVVLHFTAPLLSDDRRQRIVAAVRLMQQRVGQAEGGESEQARGAVDLPLLLLKDLTARVLELT